MSTERHGGPAFPGGPLTDYGRTDYEGMSLRDWFAGQALAGLLANPTAAIGTVNEEGVEYVARAAGLYADAMLAARSAKPEGDR